MRWCPRRRPHRHRTDRVRPRVGTDAAPCGAGPSPPVAGRPCWALRRPVASAAAAAPAGSAGSGTTTTTRGHDSPSSPDQCGRGPGGRHRGPDRQAAGHTRRRVREQYDRAVGHTSTPPRRPWPPRPRRRPRPARPSWPRRARSPQGRGPSPTSSDSLRSGRPALRLTDQRLPDQQLYEQLGIGGCVADVARVQSGQHELSPPRPSSRPRSRPDRPGCDGRPAGPTGRAAAALSQATLDQVKGTLAQEIAQQAAAQAAAAAQRLPPAHHGCRTAGRRGPGAQAAQVASTVERRQRRRPRSGQPVGQPGRRRLRRSGPAPRVGSDPASRPALGRGPHAAMQVPRRALRRGAAPAGRGGLLGSDHAGLGAGRRLAAPFGRRLSTPIPPRQPDRPRTG